MHQFGRAHLLVLLSALLAGAGNLATSPQGASAQVACAAEGEPNDQAESTLAFTGPACFDGTLEDGDQDLWLWEVGGADAAMRWTFGLTGIPATLTSLKVIPVTSDPGVTPITGGAAIVTVDVGPDGATAATAADVLIPAGRYVLGISRSLTVDSSVPADPGYRFTLEPGAPMPPDGDREPNDRADQATPLDATLTLSGDLQGSVDHHAWTIPDDAATAAWDLAVQAPIGFGVTVAIHDAAGDLVANVQAPRDGRLRVPDLQLAPGDYDVVIGPPTQDAVPYALTIERRSEPQGDPEPNDTTATARALPVDPIALRGRLGREGDRDRFLLAVDEALATQLFDLRLLWRSGLERSLCLTTREGDRLQCARGDDGVALTNLGLSAGSYVLEVDGEAAPDDPYLLRLDPAGLRVPDFEAEPNDAAEVATPFDPAFVMRGRFGPDDRDLFRVTIVGEPQRWRVDVGGAGVAGLSLVRPDTTTLASGAVSDGGKRAVLNDLFLIPGDHWIAVRGTAGDYAVTLTPLGAPDADAEREPNDEAIHAEALRIGQTRTGRLGDASDVDVHRFSLAAAEHVLLRVRPPADGAIDVRLESGGGPLVRLDEPAVGEVVELDLFLLPGDHEVWLRAVQASEDPYEVSVERLDPFTVADDQEPNDRPSLARPVPPTLEVRGTALTDFEPDWYRLAPLAAPGRITISATGAVSGVQLMAGGVTVALAREAQGTTWSADEVPDGVPLLLRVDVTGAYELRLAIPGVSPATPAAPLPVELDLVLDALAVAAYWPAGQQVEGTLTVTNDGTEPLTLTLDGTTSHFAWTVALDVDDDPGTAADDGAGAIAVVAGATATMRVRVTVPADVPGRNPVAVTVRARGANGGQATTTAEVTPLQDASPVRPHQAWTVPAALLGGLDVASLALGGVPSGSVDAAAEATLHDGVTPSGGGFATYPEAMPLALTVDLAGDALLPIVGTILNPQGNGRFDEMPRAFDLLLSEDGVDFRVVLSGELLPLTVDQPFVLPEPVPARFAQVRFHSVYGDSVNRLVLGEWKVIAMAGVTPAPEPIDIADARRGGHIVAMQPDSSTPALRDGFLDEDLHDDWLQVETGLRQTWVLGFADGRAAQVTELQWVDPTDTDPATRFDEIELEVSLVSPTGPWRPLGGWSLVRAGDGTVRPFVLEAPAWARFIRFTGDAPRKDDPQYREQPGTIRVLERPADAEYRSVLAEWGQASPAGPLELLDPPALLAIADGPDGDDTPETAVTFASGTAVAGRVQLERDVDWYAITVPDGQTSLRIAVGGTPTVGVSLTLIGPDGTEVPMTFGQGVEPGTVAYAAAVEPGATYRLRVQQPPFSAIVTFDTSGSMRPYHPFVVQAVRAFTGDVTRGRESVNLIPFEEQPLLRAFSDEPFVLQDAIDRYVPGGSGSSGAEAALIDAARELEGRQGARAILVVTDAETSTFGRSPELWEALGAVRPLIFAVHVGGDTEPVASRHLMQDWAAVAGGVYQYARSHSEVDRAFDRMATWLRRPATYTLSYETSQEAPEAPQPGSIAVRAAPEADGAPGVVPVADDVALELILDTSGSMLERLGGTRRIDIAKQVLVDLVRDELPPGTPVALRQFSQRERSCDTELSVPLGPLDPTTMAATIEGFAVLRSVNTPLAKAISEVAADLAGVTGTRIVVVVSDGQESCGGDPAKAVKRLVARGVDVTVNVVGLGLDAKARKQIRRIAAIGKGTYFDARDPAGLSAGIATAVSAPYHVFDVTGARVGGGTVNGAPVEVPPGTYRVVVLTDPEVAFDAVVVDSGGSVSLTMPIRTLDEEPAAAEP